MTGGEFKVWRERLKLTQENVADKFQVSRTAVQNWESGATPLSQAVKMGCDILESQLKQQDPDLGPVTLVYSDGPMFVTAHGPRRPAPRLRQESWYTNAGALGRVQALWKREDFHNPFIIEESGKPLWNVVELKRVVRGDDPDAPILSNLLRRIASEVKATASRSVWKGKGPTAAERQDRQAHIEKLAYEIFDLANIADGDINISPQIEAVFDKLRKAGKWPSDLLVNHVAQATVARWDYH